MNIVSQAGQADGLSTKRKREGADWWCEAHTGMYNIILGSLQTERRFFYFILEVSICLFVCELTRVDGKYVQQRGIRERQRARGRDSSGK